MGIRDCGVAGPCDNEAMSISFRLSAALAVLVAAIILTTSPERAHAARYEVTMGPNYFTPAAITIYAGDTIVWRNSDTMPHTITARGRYFDSGTVQPGGTTAFTFNNEGTHTYDCVFHSGMTGTITVLSRSQQPYTPSPAPAYVPYTYAPAAPSYTYSPSPVPSANADQLRAQAQALLARVQQLQTQLASQSGGALPQGTTGGVVTDSSSCPLIGRSLKIGSTGDDVTRLQQFLARDPAIYSEGVVSGYYGALTEAAVKRWQTKYNIVSSGTPETTGFGVVGPRTAAAIALLCTTGSYGGIPGPSAPNVGGFIQVSPVAGNAPLNVVIQATVNTVNACGGGTYLLDFGDGSQPGYIAIPTGHCTSLTQPFSHQYRYGGIYRITLSAGGHQTFANVQVFGSSAPTPSPSPSPTPTPPPATSWGIVSVTPAVGGDPFTVSVEVEYRACATYSIDWGDGGTPMTIAAKSGCASGTARATHSHTYSGNGAYTITLRDGGGDSKASAGVTII